MAICSLADSAQVGLAITTAVSLSNIFSYGASQSAEMENMFVSVERIIEYTEIEPEAPLNVPGLYKVAKKKKINLMVILFSYACK
jgi:ATP-binding cassette subfamily C (CFTR/MRP) protein 4